MVQFDRGLGSIAIRKRTNGSEGSVLLSVMNNSNSLIPSSKGSEWWTDDHAVSLTVSNSDTEGLKLLTVTIDGEAVISDWNFESGGGSYAGIRSWGVQTTYSEIEIGSAP
ncbi:hypothetical protein SDC9_186208 [bioreactor metagenome]|uniref:Uncharacterized protein n=1 Tax=bioreactor metagenome TaxID=1076179 RepID=A0A645HTI2_9ZZZZ